MKFKLHKAADDKPIPCSECNSLAPTAQLTDEKTVWFVCRYCASGQPPRCTPEIKYLLSQMFNELEKALKEEKPTDMIKRVLK